MIIDIVYPWCGEHSEKSIKKIKKIFDKKLLPNSDKKQRPNEDLKYSLRSVYTYAKWINRVYILVDKGIPPSWFNNKYKDWITVIDRNKLYRNKNNCPTFNTFSVYSIVHRIPGLSEHFIVFDDDTHIIADVSPLDFFRGNKVVVRAPFKPVPIYKDNIPKIVSQMDMYPQNKYCDWHHAPKPLLKSRVLYYNQKYKKYFNFIRSHTERFRHVSEETIMIYYYLMEKEDLIFNVQGDFYQNPKYKKNSNISNFLKQKSNYKFVNLNDFNDSTLKDNIEILRILFPEKKYYFEKNTKTTTTDPCTHATTGKHKANQRLLKPFNLFKKIFF